MIPEKLKWLKLELSGDQDNKCVPFQRYGHTAVALESNIYLWGGRNDNEVCNTLYCFNISNWLFVLNLFKRKNKYWVTKYFNYIDRYLTEIMFIFFLITKKILRRCHTRMCCFPILSTCSIYQHTKMYI